MLISVNCLGSQLLPVYIGVELILHGVLGSWPHSIWSMRMGSVYHSSMAVMTETMTAIVEWYTGFYPPLLSIKVVIWPFLNPLFRE